MITLSHAGDAGDIIYAGPTMRALADKHGDTVDLVIHPYAGNPETRTRAIQTPASVEVLAPLLRAQPYVGAVRFAERAEGVALDSWRPSYFTGLNLAHAHTSAAEVHPGWNLLRWLTVPGTTPVAPVIIHRSPRYHNDGFPWRRVVERYAGQVAMVGLPDEHAAFCAEFGNVPHHPTADLLELAHVIAGARLFIGNQSAPYAIAEGLKQNTVQETWTRDANCVFPRGNAAYGIDERTPLPSIN